MASYNELNALIDAYINRNGVQAITGQILNGVLKAMVEQLGRGYTIMGAAIPTTDPGTPDGPECYFASETGTYTDFDGLQVVPGELALLCYTPSDGWTKATIYEGFREVGATIDGNVGTPSVGVSYADGVLSFDFHNMKGNPGQNGQDGAAAGFGTIGADITGGVGTPAVSVESSGPATAKNLQFHFANLKGETGVTSVVATVDNTTGTPACTVSLVGQQLTLAFSGLKGAQGDTGSSVDYPFTIVNNLTTDDATQALSAAQGVVLDGKVSQLEAKVDGFDFNLINAYGFVTGQRINNSGAYYNDANYWRTNPIPVTPGDSLTSVATNTGINFSWRFYSGEPSTSTFLSAGSVNGRVATVPQGAAYMIVYMANSNTPATSIVCKSSFVEGTYPKYGQNTFVGGVYQKEEIDELLDTKTNNTDFLDTVGRIDSEIAPLEDKVYGVEINLLRLRTTEIVQGQRINDSGNTTNDSSYWRTNAIPVTPGDVLTSVGETPTVTFQFSFYTSGTIAAASFISKTGARSVTVPENATHVVIVNLESRNPASTSIVCKNSDISTTYPKLGMDTLINGVYSEQEIDEKISDLPKWYPGVFSLDITSVVSEKRVLYIAEDDTLYGSNGYREIFRATRIDLSDYVKVCELPVQARLATLLFINDTTAVGYVRSGLADANVEGFYVFDNADTNNWTARRTGKMDYGFPGENFQCFIKADNGYLFASEYSIKSEEHASNKIYRSTDGGESWSACYTHVVSTNTHIHAIEFDPYRQRVWCVIGDNGNGGRPGWVYSDDYGDTWTLVEAASGQTVFMDTAIIPTRKYVLIGSDMHPAGIRKWEPADDVKNAPVLASDVTHLYDIPVEATQNFGFARKPVFDTSVYPYRIAISFAYTQTYSHACLLLSANFKEWYMYEYVADPVNDPYFSGLSGITSDGWVIGYDETHGLYRYFKFPKWIKN